MLWPECPTADGAADEALLRAAVGFGAGGGTGIISASSPLTSDMPAKVWHKGGRERAYLCAAEIPQKRGPRTKTYTA